MIRTLRLRWQVVLALHACFNPHSQSAQRASGAALAPVQALLLGMDAPSQEPFLVLLGKLSETNEVSISQMSKVGWAGAWPVCG